MAARFMLTWHKLEASERRDLPLERNAFMAGDLAQW